MFPVGSLTKPQVRREAHRLSLQVAEKPDSQEICFVPDGDYASFVAQKAPRCRAERSDRRRERRAAGHARRRSPVHDRTAQGPRRLGSGADVRAAHRRRQRRRHRGPEVIARARDADGIRGELGVRGRASGVAARRRRRSVIGTLPPPARVRARRRADAPSSSSTPRSRRSRRARRSSSIRTTWSSAADGSIECRPEWPSAWVAWVALGRMGRMGRMGGLGNSPFRFHQAAQGCCHPCRVSRRWSSSPAGKPSRTVSVFDGSRLSRHEDSSADLRQLHPPRAERVAKKCSAALPGFLQSLDDHSELPLSRRRSQ